MGISLSIGAPIGNLKGDSFTGNFQRQMKDSSGNRELCEGNLEGGFLFENLEEYVK
jgi:hypothetical protein